MKNAALKSRLFADSEGKYAEFSASLLPEGERVIGVRLPKLRRIAAEILRGGYGGAEAFLSGCESEFFEEDMLEGFVVAGFNAAAERRGRMVLAFLKKIKNWSVCDSFCASLSDFAAVKAGGLFDFLEPLAKSGSEYVCRFAFVMLLMHRLDGAHLGRIFAAVENIGSGKRYAKLAAAWLLAEAYARFPKRTEAFLKNPKANPEIVGLAVRKICDSFKVPKSAKERLRRVF